MQTIKIFLGSSLDELYNERRLLGDYIMNSVRPIFKYDNVDVELLKCEDMDLGYTGEPSQNIINDQLNDCNYFIFVFKKKAGCQTRLEYDIARAIQKAGNHKSIIRVYILNGPEEGKEQGLLDFQEQLKKDGLYWSTFNNPEDIRGKIEHHLIQFEKQLLGKTKPSAFEQESETEKDGDTLFAEYELNEQTHEQKQAPLREMIHQRIDELLQQTKTVMTNEDETIAARIFKVIELYKKADQWAAATDYDKEKYYDLLFEYASFLYNYGLYYDAESIYLRQIEFAEELYGKENEKTAASYSDIGLVYYNLGYYNQALEYHHKTLAIYEKSPDTEHLNKTTSLNNIGMVYNALGNYSKAKEYYLKALKILDTERPYTAILYNNIGEMYIEQRKYDKALEYYLKALPIVEKYNGMEHNHTAALYNNISGVYDIKGNYDKALIFLLKALAIWEKTLGKEHPNTATAYNNIGEVYRKQGDYDKALEYHFKALSIREKNLGMNHLDTANSYNNIGLVYKKQGNYDKALEYYLKAYSICEKILGLKHPHTKTVLKNIKYAKRPCSIFLGLSNLREHTW